MIDLWIPITLAAAFCQNLRMALQKYLKGRLSTGGATYVRYLYSAPFSIAYVFALHHWAGMAWPEPNLVFYAYAVAGSISQIIFTALLIWLFSFRNFAVGTTFSKTEMVQIPILGFIFLGDTLSLTAVFAIAVSTAGVIALSVAQTKVTFGNLLASLTEKATVIGMVCGLFLGGSVVFFRGAVLALEHDTFMMAAAYALATAVTFQTIVMGVYLKWREPGQWTAVLRAWRPASLVGIAGNLTSVGWFTAFALQNAAYVRAVGQVELVFTFIASIVFFKERTNRLELLGVLLVVAGILMIILGR